MMATSTLPIILALPLLGAIGIAFTGRWPNLREAISLLTAVTLAVLVFSWFPEISDGARPRFLLSEPLPGLVLALSLEPLGMMFACIASFLWIINTIY